MTSARAHRGVAAVLVVVGLGTLAACQTTRTPDDHRATGGVESATTSVEPAGTPTPSAGGDASPSPAPSSPDAGPDPLSPDAFAPVGTAEPYPSACVDAYVQALRTTQDPPVPAERPVDDPWTLLLYDRLTYRISGEDFLWFAVDRAVAPERVPQEYRFPEEPVLDGVDPLTGVMFQAMWESECLRPGAVDEVIAYISTGTVPPGRD